MSQATDILELDLLTTDVSDSIDSDLAEVETASDQEVNSLDADLEQVLETPETFLNSEFAELSPEVGQQLDNLSKLAADDDDDFRRRDGAGLDSGFVSRGLPTSMRGVLAKSQVTLKQQVEVHTKKFATISQELTLVPRETHREIWALRQQCHELEKSLKEDLDELPEEVAVVLTELRELTAKLPAEVDTELNTDDLKISIAGLSTEVETSLTQAEVGLEGPVYIGETYSGPQTENQISWNFPQENQPYVGIIDTGFSAKNPDIDYSKILLGYDYIGDDKNPLLEAGERDEHGTHLLGIIGAIQDNDLGIKGINDDARLWLSRATGSGQWAEALIEFVNTTQRDGRVNAIANLSFDLVQTHPDGSISTRYELTPREREALAYAQKYGIIVVAAAGNDGKVISALGQASREFNNIVTVGAVEELEHQLKDVHQDHHGKADYSSVGMGLTLVASGGSTNQPVVSTVNTGFGAMAGTSVAAAKVAGAVSLMWAANPKLSYQQIIAILTQTAIDLEAPGWDPETGAGLLHLRAAVKVAATTNPSLAANQLSHLSLTPQPYRFKGTGASERSLFLKKLGKALKKAGKAVKKAVKKVVEGAKKVAKKVASGVKKAVKTVSSGVRRVAKKVTKKVGDAVRRVASATKKFVKKVGAGIKKAAKRAWSGVKSVSKKLWHKLQGIYHRTIHWITQLPARLKRLALQLWDGVKSLKPWSLSWWKSLGKAKTWKEFGKWLGELLIYSLETVGVGELYETVVDFFKFNTRPLNQRERTLIRSVFGNAINLNIVRVDEKAIIGPSWTKRAYVSFNTINAWGPLENDTLLHEMTHVWQYQEDGAIYMPHAIHAQGSPDPGASSGYDYLGVDELQRRRDRKQGFTNFNREQQGDIIRDYYRLREGLKRGDTVIDLYWEDAPKCEHLETYVHFVKQVSTLSAAQLMAGIVCDTTPPAPGPKPAPKRYVAGDRNESAIQDAKDFRQLAITVDGDRVKVLITTYARPAFNTFQSLYFKGGEHGQVHINLSNGKFRALGAAPGRRGLFNVPLQAGRTRLSGVAYSFEFSWSKVLGTRNAVEAWLFSQDGRDRIPEGRTNLSVRRG